MWHCSVLCKAQAWSRLIYSNVGSCHTSARNHQRVKAPTCPYLTALSKRPRHDGTECVAPALIQLIRCTGMHCKCPMTEETIGTP